LTLPALYNSITVESCDEDNLEKINAEKFLCATRRGHLLHVKHLSFWAPIYTKDQFRCIHFSQEREIDETEDETGDFHNEAYVMNQLNDLGQLMPEIRPLFDGLKDGQLKSFQYVHS
jgi:hypothetical protein